MQPKPLKHSTTQPLNKFGMPYLGYGLGLRSKHYNYILQNKPKVDWFEIISENFMDSSGRPREMLDAVRESYPIVMHGVSLSIGSSDPLNMGYLKKLKMLADDIKPEWISDHLCWTGINGINTHDLLPVPLTTETLEHITDRIKQVQDFLGRPLVLENPSSYLSYVADSIHEHEFMAQLAEKADCALLLDINNIYVSCFNHRLNAREYINTLPAGRIVQIHLAGHTHMGTHIIDTHDEAVSNDVWDLYNYTITRMGNISTMVEWDGNIPEFTVLEAEIAKAKGLRNQELVFREESSRKPLNINSTNHNLHSLQNLLQDAVFQGYAEGAESWVMEKENFPPAEQLKVYINAYRLRLAGILKDDYKRTAKFLGEEFKDLVRDYTKNVNSVYYDAAKYSWDFADYIKDKGAYEIADIERKLAECFNIKNSPAATNKNFEGLTPEQFTELRIIPRDASFLEFYPDSNNYIILYRDDEKSYQLKLEKEEYQILSALKNCKNIGEALAELPEDTDPGKIQNWFSSWVANKVISLM